MRLGELILGPVSRLDAFSVYPNRTWLPGSCRWRDNRYTRGASIPVLSSIDSTYFYGTRLYLHPRLCVGPAYYDGHKFDRPMPTSDTPSWVYHPQSLRGQPIFTVETQNPIFGFRASVAKQRRLPTVLPFQPRR